MKYEEGAFFLRIGLFFLRMNRHGIAERACFILLPNSSCRRLPEADGASGGGIPADSHFKNSKIPAILLQAFARAGKSSIPDCDSRY
jgi:hypothetical protein